MDIKVVLSIVAMTLTLHACKARRSSSSLERVSHEDVKPKAGETWTDARVASLNQWADDLLAAKRDQDDFSTMAENYFARIGIKNAEPMSRYKISLRVAKECFEQGWFSHSLYWPNQRDMLRQQIESAAVFLLEFHKATLGKPRGPFALREVEICPRETVGTDMVLYGQKLVLGIHQGSAGGYSPISSDAIKRGWDNGDHLNTSKVSILSRKKLNALWQIFNPVGTVRTSLRLVIAEQGPAILRRLEPWARTFGLKILGPASPSDRTPAAVQGTLNSPMEAGEELVKDVLLPSVDPSKLGLTPASLNSTVESIAQSGKLPILISNWACAAQNQDYAEDLATSATSVFEQTFRGSQSKAAIDITAGWVAVGNYHKIGVAFAGGGGAFKDFIQKPDVVDDQLELKVKVTSGLVSVFTVDEINVQASIGVLNQITSTSLETMALKMALSASQKSINLCQSL